VSGSSLTATGGGHTPLSPLIHGRVRLLVLSYLVARCSTTLISVP
jgi:hypothetical protein